MQGDVRPLNLFFFGGGRGILGSAINANEIENEERKTGIRDQMRGKNRKTRNQVIETKKN